MLNIIDNLLIFAIHILCFIAGMKIANSYNRKAQLEQKEALERQYLRIQAKVDADDPCKPYVNWNTGDFDGDKKLKPISEQFMNELRTSGQAKTTFRKSDLAK